MPTPTEEEQRREDDRRDKLVVKELREHQQEVEQQKDEAIDCRSQVLTDHFRKAETNLDKARTADQALIDAQIFHRLGEFSKKQAAQLQMGLQSFDVKTFTDNLVVYMRTGNGEEQVEEATGSASINFAKLGDSLWHTQKKVAGLDFMFGNEPVENLGAVTERKKIRKVKKGGIAERPDNLKSGEVQQTETDRQVAEMMKVLYKRRQCNFWLFVIDPKSFSRSIENIFHSSFLVKDRRASIDFKVDPPMIRYLDPEDKESGREQGGPQHQSEFIMSFGYNVFLEMINKHQIRQCILPRRKRSAGSDPYGRDQQGDNEDNGSATF